MSLTNLKTDRTKRSLTIGGDIYSYKMLPALVASDVGTKLIEVLGPSIGAAVDGMAKADYIMPDESTFWSEITMHLSQSLKSFKLSELAEVVLYEVYCNSQRVDVNEHFTGALGDFYKVFFDAMKENFGELFLELLRARGLEIHTWQDLMNLGKPEVSTEESQSESNESVQ